MDYTEVSIKKKKKIALIAHDNMKKELIDWIMRNKSQLSNHSLCGTGTTAKLIRELTGIPVEGYMSGPLGGDQQIGSRIAEGDIDMMVFFWDPLEAQPHDPDVKALLRISVLYNIPIANNSSTADFLLASPLMNEEYKRSILDYSKLMEKRTRGLLEK